MARLGALRVSDVLDGPSSTPLKKASTKLFTYMEENDYFDSPIDKTTQDKVKEQVLILIQKFGKKPLGFKKSSTTLGPALKHFGLCTFFEKLRFFDENFTPPKPPKIKLL